LLLALGYSFELAQLLIIASIFSLVFSIPFSFQYLVSLLEPQDCHDI